MSHLNIADLRLDYKAKTLDLSDAAAEPIAQFELWFSEALSAKLHEPNAMTLATATPDGVPSARIVLLKAIDERGFIFYSNFDSRKGQELAKNPKVALVFLWHELERQVRIEGTVERVADEVALAYFQSRPRSSQVGAWASPQSEIIVDRNILEDNVRRLEATYPQGEPLPLPPHWGGFRVLPHALEFWQGRRSRLHDRLRYERQSDQSWKITRLAP